MPRSRSWGFPRWGGYGSETQQPKTLRNCDHDGCNQPGDHPAPKSRQSDEKFWFCQQHAADYNRSWNYFAGMSYEEMRRAAAENDREAAGYRQSSAWTMAESGSMWSVEERQALRTLGLEEEAAEDEIKARYRELAKRHHPDANRDDAAAAAKFHVIHQAYNLLRQTIDLKKRKRA